MCFFKDKMLINLLIHLEPFVSEVWKDLLFIYRLWSLYTSFPWLGWCRSIQVCVYMARPGGETRCFQLSSSC